MKTKIKLKVGQHKSLILLFLFTVFWQNQTFAQSSGIMFFWDSEVGCQEYFNGEDPRGTKEPVFIEQITDGVCIRVCEQSEVIYTLSGNLGATPNTQWTVVGGTIINQTDTTCKVKWGDVGYGSIGFTITTPTETITKTLCIEKIIIPKAEFSILSASHGFEGIGTYYACANQTIYFDNLSTTNSGSTIVSYLWDFRDGTFSSEFEPNHVYAHDGTYKVRLTVYNSCGCYSVFRMDIVIKSEGFDLVCPGVVCDDQTASYSLPFDGKELCQSVTQDHWSVLGGEIIDTNPDGEVTVLWNHVDQSGFGLLTFTPLNCDLNCLLPSTLKIPVIQKEGTIFGSSTLCVNEQGRYSLPQWPTTDFHWQIFGNESGNLAEVLLTDQRNEVIIKPFGTGNLVLRCDYQNTLLHCGGFAEFTINVQNAITIEGSNAICIGSTTEYTTNSGNPVNWILKNSNGSVVDTLNDSITYSHVFTSAGNYSLTVESSLSCPTVPLNINVMAQPIAPIINGIDVICPDSPYIYNVVNPDPNSIYHWNIINGTALNSLTGNQITVNFSNDTTHGVNVYRETITPSSCVSATVTKAISNVTIPADIQGNVTVCANNNSSYQAIEASSNPVSLYEDGDTYTWSLSNPSLGSITSGQGTNNINVLWNNVSIPTTTTLQVEIRKCTVSTTFNIDVTITPALELNLTGTESMCSGNYATFSVSTNGFTLPSGALFQWSFGDGSTLTTSSTNVTHQYYTSVTNNVIRQVTVKYLTPVCNNTLSVSNTLLLTILPGPGAVASISEGGNNYCTVASIGAILSVATTPGATIEWYQNNTALGVSTNDYAVTAFGNYYFIATLNGCSTRSNVVSIYQNCQPIETCTPDPIPQVTNDSYNDCGDLILSGTTTVTPITIPVFDIFGPIQVTNYTDSVLENVEAGVYTIIYKTAYPCSEGNGLITVDLEPKQVLVPYIPKFDYGVICNGNNTFTVNVFDNSDVYAGITGLTYTYYYRPHNNSNPWTAVGVINDSLNHSFASGQYDIKLVISGYYDGVLQPECEVVQTIALQTLPGSLAITITTPPTCHDTAVGFDVTGSNPSFTHYWTFDDDAQNTLAEPFRVFNHSGNQQVSVLVTNPSGCRTTLTTNVMIPEKCFNGDVVTTPADATVCSGESVTLSYEPNDDLCVADHYQWMNGNTALSGATSSSLVVTTPGFYWLKVYSVDNCLLDTPSRITPVFKPLPAVALSSEGTFCYNSDKKITAITSATILGWKLDGDNVPYTAGYSSIMLPIIPAGNHVIEVTVSQNGCINSAQQTITIVPVPNPPTLEYEIISCNPYSVQLTVTNPQTTGIYNWSNGMTGTSIVVPHGGPYRATYSTGGCSNSNQIFIPKNPEDYIWIFPSGCINSCDKIIGTLIGPRVPLGYWGWLQNEIVEAEHHDSFPESYLLDETAVYNLTYQTAPGNSNGITCSILSEPLNYTLTYCDTCYLDELSVKSITKNESKFCSFTVEINLVNTNSQDIISTIGTVSNALIITPSVVTLHPGFNQIFLTVIPVDNLGGAVYNLFFTSTVDGKPCMNELELNLPSCGGEENSTQSKTDNSHSITSKILLHPNPAKDEVMVEYSGLTGNHQLELYDLTGRLLFEKTIGDNTGIIEIATSNYPSGVYVVVLRNAQGIQNQHRLVVE